MRGTLVIVVCSGLVASVTAPGAAAPKSSKLAKCDGKARRPANPYGSILPTVDPAAGTMLPPAPGPGAIDVFPPSNQPPPKPSGSPPTAPGSGTSPTPVPPIGAIDPSPHFRSC